jgi:transcription factor SPN1
MPIETHQYYLLTSIRQSGIGRIVMFYTKHDKVTEPVKRLAEILLRKWMRPILGKSADHKHLKLPEAEFNFEKSFNTFKPIINAADDGRQRARIPAKLAPAFTVAPRPLVPVGTVTEKKPEKYRKLKSTMQKFKSRKK